MTEIIWRPSPNYNERKTLEGMAPVRRLVLHYTGMPDGQGAEDWLCNPESGVSCHYILHEDGRIVQMVAEEKRAWHAGAGSWLGEGDLNSSSVGIEIVNPGHEWGYRPFTDAQMQQLLRLVGDISRRHHLQPLDVIGHSDLAPARKTDPGELFDWELLAKHGLAVARPERLLPDPQWDDAMFVQQLHHFGYDVSDEKAATIAFQRRFRQDKVDGAIDAEMRAILNSLLNGVPEGDGSVRA